INEYNDFPFKNLVPLDLKQTLNEVVVAINSCRFFVGNQSSPLAIAASLGKNLLCESSEFNFYRHDYNNYISNDAVRLTIPLNQKRVLLVNHKIKQCGVYQYGKRLFNLLLNCSTIHFDYREIDNINDYRSLLHSHYDIIIYNYYASTLPWLNNHNIQKKCKNIGLHHENDIYIHFDQVLQVRSFGRPLFKFNSLSVTNPIPVIGSFGFGFNNKGFDKIIQYVNDQFDEAIIRLNITSAHFGDGNDQSTKKC